MVRFDRDFDWGLSLSGSYTLQDVRDISNATSSTINSNYRFQVFGADPNFPVLGTSDSQIKWQFKYSVGYDHAFFRDYRTKIQLFGESRAGKPYTFVMNENTANRSPVFGTVQTANQGVNLLYVPTGTSDPLVSYDSTTTQDALNTLINNTALKKYRGQIAAKNIARSRANTRIDLHLEQELPTFIGNSRVSVFADINNFTNLLNKNWGGLRQVTPTFSNPTAVVVQVLEGEGAILRNRALMGATDPKKADAGTIRADFAASIDANAVHGSDSAESAKRELAYFFFGSEIVNGKK